jgi:hypothetical protein
MQCFSQNLEFVKVLPVSNLTRFRAAKMCLNVTFVISMEYERANWSQFVSLCLSLG